MNKNLGWKLSDHGWRAGIIRIRHFWHSPAAFPAALAAAALQNRISLGLDLKGGTHLILQVQVNDAVNVDTDNALRLLKSGMRNAKINYTDLTKPDPTNHPEQIVIKGVPPEASSDLRTIVQDRLPEYDLTSGANNT